MFHVMPREFNEEITGIYQINLPSIPELNDNIDSTLL